MLQQDDTKPSQMSLSPSRALHWISPGQILGKSTLLRRDKVNLELNEAFHSAVQQYRSESTRKEAKQRQNLSCLFRTPCDHSRPTSAGTNHLTEALLGPDICVSVRYPQSLILGLKTD